MAVMDEVRSFNKEQRAEILKEYRGAKDQIKQIKTLADLHDVSASAIKQVLIEMGVAPEALVLRQKSRAKPFQPVQKGSKVPGVLAALREELEWLEQEAEELPDRIEALKKQYAAIGEKRAAVEQCIALLGGMEDK